MRPADNSVRRIEISEPAPEGKVRGRDWGIPSAFKLSLPTEPNDLNSLNSRRRWLFWGLCGAVIALGAVWYWRQLGRECTDDAQLDGDVIAIPSRITAVVKRIAFKDNQRVHAGELLVELDDEQPKARLAQAEASYDAAVAAALAAEEEAVVAVASAHGNHSMARASLACATYSVRSTHAQATEAEAAEDAARATAEQVHRDYQRAQRLAKAGIVSEAELDQAHTEDARAAAALAQARSHHERLKTDVAVASSHLQEADAKVVLNDVVAFVNQARARAKAAQAQVAVAKANLELAKIELSYTQIVAPVTGTISKRSAAVGQILGAGQPIAQLVPADPIWVTANFKETQLRSIRVAQPVDISVDANPSQPLNGVVESFSAAAGVRFALLPPDNATGNFTKVVQRVPVRIKLTRVPKDQLLLPGLNVEVVVRTR